MISLLLYRLKQFYFGMTAKYGQEDKIFTENYLNSAELNLFNQLPNFEKKHAVVVARKMMVSGVGFDERKLAKLGLLHDIGKLAENNSIFTKSIMVIIRFFLPSFYDWLAEQGKNNPWLKRFYVHKHHGQIGAEMLAKIGVSGEYLSIITKHDPRIEPFGPQDPPELKILQAADSTY
ncbi:MAG: HD domain-containing protein [bacterium]